MLFIYKLNIRVSIYRNNAKRMVEWVTVPHCYKPALASSPVKWKTPPPHNVVRWELKYEQCLHCCLYLEICCSLLTYERKEVAGWWWRWGGGGRGYREPVRVVWKM